MIGCKAGLGLLVAVFFMLPANADPVYQALGEARDIKTGNLLYTEQHRRNGIDHVVNYFLPDGKLIVTNKQNFQYSPYVPTIEQTDLRDNERSGLLREDDGWVLYNNDQRETVKNDDPLVASAGFDTFIRQHWDYLSKGQAIDFDFVVPQSMMLAPLRMVKIDCKKADISRVTENYLCLEVTPSSLFFSFFFDPIEVAYDKDSRLLMAYRGLTNLNNSRGDAYEAEIFYSYKKTDQVTKKETPLLSSTK